MKKIVTAMDFVYDPKLHAYTPKQGTSQTVPGQDTSVRFMFSRFVQERPLPVIGKPFFTGDGEESFLELDRLTIQEKLDMKRNNDAFIEVTTAQLKQKKATADAVAKQNLDKELEELRALKAKSEAVQ